MKLNYTVKGNGDNLILLHGWGGSLKSLENLQTELARYFRVYNIELPGHGIEKQLDTVWTLSDFSEKIKTFLEELKIENPILIGHSFGGKVILKTLINNPEIASKVILINASGIKPENDLKKTLGKLISIPLKPIFNLKAFGLPRKLIYRFILGESDYSKLDGNLRETFTNVVNEHLDSDVNKINSKVLLIWGKDDDKTPIWMANKLNEAIKDSELLEVEGRHNLPLAMPKGVAAIIREWIN